MDIKAEAEKLIKKITENKTLLADFKKDPIGTVKKLLGGVDLSKDQLDNVVDLVKAKVNVDDAKGIIGKIGGLFGKKD